MDSIIFQTSLVAAFVAGMVALFAPCCITFLLPAYLGSVFKEKGKILFMTLVFGLGVFVVLLPAVLGVQFVSKLLFRSHDTVYLLGAGVMIVVSVITFLGIKLPMPSFSQKNKERPDVASIFILGVFSGIASACCAPVLIGILTLSFFSPGFFGSILIGGVYVLGMVVPLLFISMFLEGKMPKISILRKNLGQVSLFGKTYYLIGSNVIASAIFFITGILTIVLTLTGRLTMGNTYAFTRMIQNAGAFVNESLGNSVFINIAFVIVIIYVIYRVVRKI